MAVGKITGMVTAHVVEVRRSGRLGRTRTQQAVKRNSSGTMQKCNYANPKLLQHS